MHISGEGKIGIALGLVALAGGGGAMNWPDHSEIGWAMMIIAGIGGVMLADHHFAPGQVTKHRMIVLIKRDRVRCRTASICRLAFLADFGRGTVRRARPTLASLIHAQRGHQQKIHIRPRISRPNQIVF
jgi:hypothetical protein